MQGDSSFYGDFAKTKDTLLECTLKQLHQHLPWASLGGICPTLEFISWCASPPKILNTQFLAPLTKFLNEALGFQIITIYITVDIHAVHEGGGSRLAYEN